MSTKDEALRLAAQRVLDAWDYPQGTTEMHRRMRALRDAMAESEAIDTSGQRVEESVDSEHETAQQQEPAVWNHDCAALLQNDVELWIDRCPHCGKPRTTPPAMRRATREEKISNPGVYEVPVDTPPPENKPWVGLTPEDIAGAPDNPIALIAYIEAKLREKNGGAA